MFQVKTPILFNVNASMPLSNTIRRNWIAITNQNIKNTQKTTRENRTLFCRLESRPMASAPLQRDRLGRINANWRRRDNMARRFAGDAVDVIQSVQPESDSRNCILAQCQK